MVIKATFISSRTIKQSAVVIAFIISLFGCQNVNYVQEKPILIPEDELSAPQHEHPPETQSSETTIVYEDEQGIDESGIIIIEEPNVEIIEAPVVDAEPIIENQELVYAAYYDSIWQLLSSHASFALETERSAVKKQIRRLQNQPDHLIQIKGNTEYFIGYVSQQLLKRGLPIELALLPIIESNYNPHAYSRARAVGVWQFIPQTADIFNLHRGDWLDERRDIVKSTEAALNYLQELHQEFNNDWLLALAAYNAGEGVVRSAIRENRSQGKQGNFWSLNLPLETQNYIPKLLALSAIIQQPEFYNYTLPHISASPVITIAPLESTISLEVLADALSMSMDDIRILNAQFLKSSTPPGSHNLILPIAKLDTLENTSPELMAALHLDESHYLEAQKATVVSIPYTVRNGDSLWSIARKHGVTVEQLQRWNKLTSSTTIHPGQRLSIGAKGAKTQRQTYFVKAGDTLWSLAIKFNCSIAELKKWNSLSDNDLNQNQKLIVMTY